MISYEMEELLPIVSELVMKYTSNESSSVTYEKANQLMEAVLFCIRELGQEKEGLILNEDKIEAKTAYELGFEKVKSKVEQSLDMYHSVLSDFRDFRIVALRDTIVKGMPEFFRHYDIWFQPQNQILTLDYPTIRNVDALQGIDAIYQYLCNIQYEQEFLSKLSDEFIVQCLVEYHEEYEELLINVASIVLRKIIRSMSGAEWENIICGDREDIESEMQFFLLQLIKEKYNNEKNLYEYLSYDLTDYSYWLQACK